MNDDRTIPTLPEIAPLPELAPRPAPTPGGDHVKLDVTLDRVTIPVGDQDARLECNVELVPSPELSIERVRTSICLVFDCSESMRGERIQAALRAARLIVDSANERNTISLVAFSAKSHLLVREQQATERGKLAMREQIDALPDLVHGSTNMAAGIARGTLAVKGSLADAKVMIVLSDGIAKKAERTEAAALAAAQAGIHLFAVGLGPNSGIDRLEKLVAHSNGAVFEQKDAGSILLTFSHLLERIRRFVATNVYLDLKFGDGVIPKRLVRTSPEKATLDIPRPTRLNVGNIEQNATYKFAVSLAVHVSEPGDYEILRATLCYDVPSLALRNQTQEVSVAVQYVADPQAKARAKPAAPAEQPAAAKKATGTKVDNQTVYDVHLTDAGSDLILVLREVRGATGLSLKRVMELIKSGGAIQQGLKDPVAAEAFKQRLAAVGAQAQVRSRHLRVRSKVGPKGP